MSDNSSIKEGSDSLVWDKLALYRRCRQKGDRVRMLVVMFLEDMPDNMSSLKEAISHSTFSEIQRLAHTIKGVSANLGADLLSQSMSRVEGASIKENFQSCQLHFKDSLLRYNDLIEELNAFMRSD